MFNTNICIYSIMIFVRNSISVLVEIVLFSGALCISHAMLLDIIRRQKRRVAGSLLEFGSVDSCHDDGEELDTDNASSHN